MLEQKMKAVAMVMMAQMAKFVEQDIVLKDARKTNDIEVQIDVSLG